MTLKRKLNNKDQVIQLNVKEKRCMMLPNQFWINIGMSQETMLCSMQIQTRIQMLNISYE